MQNLAQYGNVNRVIQFLSFRTFDLRYHVGFMQYDGTTKEIKLCMLRIPLGVPGFVRDKAVEISRVSRVNVLPKIAELLEHYGIGYELCVRIITQVDLQYLAVSNRVNSQLRGALRMYFSEISHADITDEVLMKELTRKPFMDVIYLYYLGQ